MRRREGKVFVRLQEETIKTERLFDGHLVHLRRDTVRLPNGRVATREIIEHPGAVAVLALTGTGEVVLVKQFRKPIEEAIWEIPAGKLDPGEAPSACARRELWEETGYEAAEWTLLTSVVTTPGFTDEVIHLFLASGARRADGATVDCAGGPDEDELVEVKRFPAHEVLGMIRKGEIKDAKSICTILAWAFWHRQDS